ncbi:hypothetical protein PPYR_11207 [Photinus pyralis]|uniref:Tetraspanin n=1 Tax=Photinus pyralis TaxID=7054 RepID=A0A5N4AAT7_PHOPY|nr:hypothetical protein PPYR_11207 [Photinus pyralis]
MLSVCNILNLAGIAFIAVGAVYLLDIKSVTAAVDRTGIPFSVAPTLLLVVGIVVFVISFLGCCGAVKESYCLLITYGVILLVLFLLQVGIGAYAFMQLKDSDGADKVSIENELRTTMREYPHSNQAQATFDTLQGQLKCCGVRGPSDWNGVTVPLSCCEWGPTQCYLANAYQDGCFPILYSFLHQSITIIGIIFVTIGGIELLGAICAFCLCCSL